MAIKIALVGKHNVGKTWAARYLEKQHNFTKISFSRDIDKIIKMLYSYGNKERVKWDKRIALYDAWYKIDPNIWINHIKWRVGATRNDIVVDDARYLNEIVALKNLGFTVIRLSTPPGRTVRNWKAAGPGMLKLHETYNKNFSEYVGVDFSIENGPNQKEITRKSLDQIVEKLRKLDNETFSEHNEPIGN